MRIAPLVFLAANLSAQWLDYIPANVPRTRDGKPNLSAPAPRAIGKPDLSGVWLVDPQAPGEYERLFGRTSAQFDVPGDDVRNHSRYFINFFFDAAPNEKFMRPLAEELTKKNAQSANNNPTTNCLPRGIPEGELLSNPFKIVQTPGYSAILYEGDFNFREIYTDGRKLPVNPEPSWLGYSIGKWEGDTFVVDTTGFNTSSWIDAVGHPRSESMRLQERFHRRDFGHMDLQITVDDPVMYTRSATVNVTYHLLPGSGLLQAVCIENEKDRSHMEQK